MPLNALKDTLPKVLNLKLVVADAPKPKTPASELSDEHGATSSSSASTTEAKGSKNKQGGKGNNWRGNDLHGNNNQYHSRDRDRDQYRDSYNLSSPRSSSSSDTQQRIGAAASARPNARASPVKRPRCVSCAHAFSNRAAPDLAHETYKCRLLTSYNNVGDLVARGLLAADKTLRLLHELLAQPGSTINGLVDMLAYPENEDRPPAVAQAHCVSKGLRAVVDHARTCHKAEAEKVAKTVLASLFTQSTEFEARTVIADGSEQLGIMHAAEEGACPFIPLERNSGPASASSLDSSDLRHQLSRGFVTSNSSFLLCSSQRRFPWTCLWSLAIALAKARCRTFPLSAMLFRLKMVQRCRKPLIYEM